MKRLLFLSCALFLATNALALEPLPLSETQIQKLKSYYPSEDEHAPLVWKGDPLSVALPLHAEKRIVFPEPIEANLNSALNSDQLRIINNDQSLYLTALKSFSTQRLYVTLKQSNKIILLDIATSDQATTAMRTVKLDFAHNISSSGIAGSNIVTTHQSSVSQATNTIDTFSGSANNYVSAIRFAWQQIYAPQRLLNKNADFVRTPMHTQKWVADLVYGDKVFAYPEASWIAGELYVTAVALRNKYPHATNIDLKKNICGEWKAAALYPNAHLKPSGDKSGDSTTLFLISNKPFGDALEWCHGSA